MYNPNYLLVKGVKYPVVFTDSPMAETHNEQGEKVKLPVFKLSGVTDERWNLVINTAKPEKEMRRVLFLNDCNGHEGDDPYATLIEFSQPVTTEMMKGLEYTQLGVNRRGGSLSELLAALEKQGITSKKIAEGRRSTLDHDVYNLVSGNY